ncbi:MAG: hypothetical protein WCV71_02710 [Patescibacteria group bacterium]
MKNKNLIILGFLIVSFSIFLSSINVQAAGSATDLTYRPNVPLPITIGGINFAGTNVITGGDFLAKYIVAIYSYGAGFAGIIAMFMLVIAGWKWLMAAGNAQKISGAKDIINGVLIGLALLFGGQLLLRQISQNFSSVQSLSVKLPEAALRAISANQATVDWCQEKKGADGDGGECSDYVTEANCANDVCVFLENPRDFDNRCIPDFDRAGIFERCSDCPNRCDCEDNYSSIFYRNIDACDCDEDGLWPDTNGCDGIVEIPT